MSKGSRDLKKNGDRDAGRKVQEKVKNPDYFFRMSAAPELNESTHWLQMLPAAFFTAVVITIVRLHVYERPMEQFYWANNENSLTEFFSYFKMAAILTCAIFAVIILLYRVFTQSFYVKRNSAYIPIIIYTLFVILSYVFSDYKIFALWGFNDRFEGTVTQISYMIMLFFIINSVITEENVKWLIYPVAVFSSLLGILGITQALGHDFFRTTIGKKMITPGWFWDKLDSLNFTFQKNEIYQTVYNINYVSLYLTLLIPLFGMLFIRSINKKNEEVLWKKIIWGAIFTLLVFNLIGSVSSGGYLGMIIILLLGFIVLNKRIITWKKPVLILFALAVLMCFINIEQLQKEFDAAQFFFSKNIESAVPGNPSTPGVEATKSHIDYIDTDGEKITLSINGNVMVITTYPDDPSSVTVKDDKGENIPLELVSGQEGFLHKFNDDRFSMLTFRPANDDNGNIYYIFYLDGNSEWPFRLTPDGPKYMNQLGKLVDLDPITQIGFKNNPHFGSGRGFIWSNTLPMLYDTIIIGHGADTFGIYYPQNNYAGKYNVGWDFNVMVDKPHCMYLGIAINTGLVSLLALVVLWGIYIAQSVRLYFRSEFKTDFNTYAGCGIFLGVCGFLAAALVNDSSVSVMPLFYGLLGTGIAINMILKRNTRSVENS